MSLVEVKSNTASTSFLTEDTEVSQLTTTQRIQPHDSNNTPHTLLSTLSHRRTLSWLPGAGVHFQSSGSHRALQRAAPPHRHLPPAPTNPHPPLAAPSIALLYGRNRTQEEPQRGSKVASESQSPCCHWRRGSGGTSRVLSGSGRECSSLEDNITDKLSSGCNPRLTA